MILFAEPAGALQNLIFPLSVSENFRIFQKLRGWGPKGAGGWEPKAEKMFPDIKYFLSRKQKTWKKTLKKAAKKYTKN